MAVLGSLGNFYVRLLFLFLIGGSGLIAFNFSKSFWEKSEKFMDKKGGKFMNKWIRLAVTSFAGILIASFALGITSNMSGADSSSAHNHGAGQMTGMTAGQAGSGANDMSNMGQMNQNQMTGSYDARLYQLQVNMMQMQQQLWQIMQMYAAQQGNYPGMGGYPNGSMYNPNMGNMNSMNGMNNMNNMGNAGNMGNMSSSNNSNAGNMSGGGMSMM